MGVAPPAYQNHDSALKHLELCGGDPALSTIQCAMSTEGMEKGVEASAVGLLKRAVELDGVGRFTESLVCYQEGIQLLLQILKGKTASESKKKQYRTKITEYMDRAETIKELIATKKKDGTYREQVKIEDTETGHSYETLFGRYFEAPCLHVEIEDPYIHKPHQIMNFVRFCELCVKKKCGIQRVVLITVLRDAETEITLRKMADNLKSYSIQLVVKSSDTLHDREISPFQKEMAPTKYETASYWSEFQINQW